MSEASQDKDTKAGADAKSEPNPAAGPNDGVGAAEGDAKGNKARPDPAAATASAASVASVDKKDGAVAAAGEAGAAGAAENVDDHADLVALRQILKECEKKNNAGAGSGANSGANSGAGSGAGGGVGGGVSILPDITRDVCLRFLSLMEVVGKHGLGAGAEQASVVQVQVAVQALRMCLSIEKNPPIQMILDEGCLPHLAALMDLDVGKYSKLVFEATWCVTNIVSGTTSHARQVVEAGIVHKLMAILNSNNDECVDQAVWAIGNIAGDGVEMRDVLLEHDILPTLVNLVAEDKLDSIKQQLLRNTVWAISNFCRGKPRPEISLVECVMQPFINIMQTVRDEEVLIDCCWTFSYLADSPVGNDDGIESVVRSGAVPELIKCLQRQGNKQLVSASLRACANLVTGPDATTESVLDEGLLDAVVPVLSSLTVSHVKEAAWCLSNITAGDVRQIQSVIDTKDAVAKTIDLWRNSHTETIRKECAYVIANLFINGTPQQIAWCMLLNPFDAMVRTLREYRQRDRADWPLVNSTLDAITKILKQDALAYTTLLCEAGGRDVVDSYTAHRDHVISTLALNIRLQHLSREEVKEQ